MPTPAPASSKSSSAPGAAPAAAPTAQPISTDPSLLDLAALLDPEAASPAADDQGEEDESDTDLDPAEPQGSTGEADDDAEETPAAAAPATEDEEAEEAPAATEEEETEDPAPEGEEAEAAAPEADDEAEIKALLKRARFTPEQQQVFNKAIGKKQRAIVQLRTDLEQATTDRTTLETQLTELRTMVDAPAHHAADTPLGEVDDEAALAQKTANLRALRRWARMNPDGGELPDGKGGKIEKTAEEVRAILADAEEMLEEAVPARQRYLEQRRTFDQQATAAYSWLKDTKSPAAIAHAALMRQYAPLLRAIPEARLVMADALVGASLRVQASKQAAAAKPGDTQKKPTLPTRPGAATPAKAPPAAVSRPAPKTSATAKKATARAESFVKTGRDEDGAVLSSLLGAGG